MASSAGVPELDLTNSIRAKLWLTAFSARARSKKWNDTLALEATATVEAVDADLQITDNFISVCGLNALELIGGIVAPRKMEDMPFADIRVAIERFLEPQAKLVVAERAKFYQCVQSVDESVSKFVAKLRKQAECCAFAELKHVDDPCEEMVKMGLIAGLRDTDIKRKVLEAFQSKVLSVPEIVNMVQQVEKVVEFVSINRRVENVGRVFDDDVNHAQPNKVFSGVCFNCGINGHVARFCRKKSSKRLKCFGCVSDHHLANKCPVKNANCVDESCADDSLYCD